MQIVHIYQTTPGENGKSKVGFANWKKRQTMHQENIYRLFMDYMTDEQLNDLEEGLERSPQQTALSLIRLLDQCSHYMN